MKAIKLIVLFSVMLSLVSCGSSKKAQRSQHPTYPYYGDYQPEPTQQPQHAQQNTAIVQNENTKQQEEPQRQDKIVEGADEAGFVEVKKSPIEEMALVTGTNEIRAYGSAESGNEQLALNAARAQAMAALQEKIDVYVRAGLDQYIEEVGVDNVYSLDESTTSQVQTAVKGIVKGAKVLDTRKLYNPNTKRYKCEVCVAYERAGVLKTAKVQNDRIKKNEKQFEDSMKKAWDELDAQNQMLSTGGQQMLR